MPAVSARSRSTFLGLVLGGGLFVLLLSTAVAAGTLFVLTRSPPASAPATATPATLAPEPAVRSEPMVPLQPPGPDPTEAADALAPAAALAAEPVPVKPVPTEPVTPAPVSPSPPSRPSRGPRAPQSSPTPAPGPPVSLASAASGSSPPPPAAMPPAEPLDEATLRSALTRHSPDFDRCYYAAYPAPPGPRVPAALTLQIAPAGHVTQAHAQASNPSLAQCLTGVLQRIRFPARAVGSHARSTITLYDDR